MRLQPNLHWNNFTVSELEQILKHCTALEKIGIAQDEQMMRSIKNDLVLRTKKAAARTLSIHPKRVERPIVRVQSTEKRPREELLEQVV